MAASDQDKPSFERTWGRSAPDRSNAAQPQSGKQPSGKASSRPNAPPGTPAKGPALIPLGRHGDTAPIPLTRPAIVIGSRSNARIHLVSSKISRAHALLVQDNGVTYIRDLASRTGVQINDEPVREALLHDGDTISMGSFSFRFIAGPDALPDDQEQTAPAAVLIPGEGGPALPLEDRVILIGRRSVSDIPLLEPTASTSHAAIFRIGGRHAIRDLGSRTGTLVNGVITRQQHLNPGDVVRIGDTELRYMPAEQEQEAAAPAELVAEAQEFAPPEPEQTAVEPLIVEPTAHEPAAPQFAGLEMLPEAESLAPDKPIGVADHEPVDLPPLHLEPEPQLDQPPLPSPAMEHVAPAEEPLALSPSAHEPAVPEFDVAGPAEPAHRDEAPDRLEYADDLTSPVAVTPGAPPATDRDADALEWLTEPAAPHEPLDLSEPAAVEPPPPPIQIQAPPPQAPQPPEETQAPDAPFKFGTSPDKSFATARDSTRVSVSKTRNRPDPIATQLPETLSPTEPTPESAMPLIELGTDTGETDRRGGAAATIDTPALSDTQFDRAVGEFAGSGFGDLVVEPTAGDRGPSRTVEDLSKPPSTPRAPGAPGVATSPPITPGALGGLSGGHTGPSVATTGRPPTQPPPDQRVAPAASASPPSPPLAAPPPPHFSVAPKGLASLAEGMRTGAPRRRDETIPPYVPGQSGIVPPGAPRPRGRRQIMPLFGQSPAGDLPRPSEPPEVVKRVAQPGIDPRAFADTSKSNRAARGVLTPMDLVFDETAALHGPLKPGEPAAPTQKPDTQPAGDSGSQELAASASRDELALTEVPHETATPDVDPSASYLAMPDLAALRRRARSRPGAVLPMPVAMPAPAAAVPDDAPVPLPRLRRKRLMRLWLCLAAAPVLGALGAIAGWSLGPVHNIVEAHVQFAGLEKQNRHDRVQFQQSQLQHLTEVSARRAAMEKLQALPNASVISPGFLGDPRDYDGVARGAAFSPEQPNLLVVRHEGLDSQADRERLKAVVLAMYDFNAPLRDEAERSAEKLRRLTDRVGQGAQRLEEIKRETDHLRPLVDGRPTALDIAAAQDQLGKLQQAYEDARASRMQVEADLKRIGGDTAGAATPTTAPAVAAAAPTTQPDDSHLQSLQQELAQLDQQTAQAQRVRQADQDKARAALDAAMSQFQQQIDSTKQQTQHSPVLMAYVDTAQKALESARSAVDEFVHQEEQTYTALTDLRARLNEKMEEQRAAMWASDKELKELNDRQEIAKRQYNAAVAGALTKEAADYKAQIDLTTSMIQAREELLPQDPLYADMVAQLQQLIDTQRKKLDENRAAAEKTLASLQDQLQQSQPTDQSVSPEEKALAADLTKRLSDVNDARRRYAEASGSADTDESARKLADQRQQVATAIAARKQTLADAAAQQAKLRGDQQRETDLTNMRQQRDSLTQAEHDALAAFNQKDHQLATLKQQDADGRDAAARLADVTAERNGVQAGLDQDNRDLAPAAEDANLAIVQIPFNEGGDLRIVGGTNMRPFYALIVGGGAALLMLAVAGMNLLASVRELHAADSRDRLLRARAQPPAPWSQSPLQAEPDSPTDITEIPDAAIVNDDDLALPAEPEPDSTHRLPAPPIDARLALPNHETEPAPITDTIDPALPADAPADEFEGLLLEPVPRTPAAPSPTNGLADDEAALLEELFFNNDPQPANPPDPAATNGNPSEGDLDHPTRRAV